MNDYQSVMYGNLTVSKFVNKFTHAWKKNTEKCAATEHIHRIYFGKAHQLNTALLLTVKKCSISIQFCNIL